MSRKGTVDALSQIEELDRLIFGPDSFDPGLYEKLANRKSWGEAFMFSDGIVKGYVLAHNSDSGVVVHRLVVHPEHRGKGYGTQLLRSMMLKGREHLVYCPERWLDSQRWLTRRGWTAIRVERGYYSGQDAFVFRRGPRSKS